MTVIISSRPFNTAIESGLRSLVILARTAPKAWDLQRMVYYDYLLVHSGDVEDGPKSLHPPTPHRSGEWIVRRELVSSGLNLMFSKELIDKKYSESGVLYACNDLTIAFLSHLESPYGRKLSERANWLNIKFTNFSDTALSTYMEKSVGKWGAEFKREALVRGKAL